MTPSQLRTLRPSEAARGPVEPRRTCAVNGQVPPQQASAPPTGAPQSHCRGWGYSSLCDAVRHDLA